tara:strand:+ start:2542 stop:2988 length:447 start_codon:yes stop_codon:yes gene_type:complete
MEHINDPRLTMLNYPIGENLSKNLEGIGIMSEIIQDQYQGTGLNIWCRGSSGSIIAAIIAKDYIDKGGLAKICHVKKDREYSHSDSICYEKDFINIIVDDFVCSGETIRAIYSVQQNTTKNRKVDSIIVTGTYEGRDFRDKIRLLISQ